MSPTIFYSEITTKPIKGHEELERDEWVVSSLLTDWGIFME